MKSFFSPPALTDNKETHITHLLYVFLWTSIIAVSVVILITLVLPEVTANQLLLIGTVDASSLLLLVLTSRGYTRLVSWMVVLQMWVITTSLVSTGGGIHNPAVILYLIVVLMAGLTLGQRVGLIIAGFCLLTELLFVYTEQAGYLIPSVIENNALTIWVSNTWAMIIIVALQYFAASTVGGLFERVHWQLNERLKAENALSVSEERYREIINHIDEGYFEVDLAGCFTFFNDILPKSLGYSRDELMSKDYKTMMDESDVKKVSENFQEVYRTGEPKQLIEWETTKKYGSKIYVESSISLAKDAEGRPVGFRGVVRDITVRKKAEERLHAMAITDQLTGFPNRGSFITLVEQQLSRAAETRKKGMLVLINIDGMKRIHDMRGLEGGSKVLLKMANLLKQVFRKSDIIARVGGGEFAIFAPEVTDTMHDIFLGRLRYQLNTINSHEEQEFGLSVSVGSSFYDPNNPCSVDVLMSEAGRLMYQEKPLKNG